MTNFEVETVKWWLSVRQTQATVNEEYILQNKRKLVMLAKFDINKYQEINAKQPNENAWKYLMFLTTLFEWLKTL